MWTRLVGLVLVPLVGISVVARPMVVDRLDLARATRATETDVESLNALLDLRFALTVEAEPSETLVRGRGFGLTPEQSATLMGFDVLQRMAFARASTDTSMAVASLRSPDLVAQVRPMLDGFRAVVDTPGADVQIMHAGYITLTQLVVDATHPLLATLASGGTGRFQTAGLDTATTRVVAVFDLVNAGQAALDGLFRLTVPGAAPAADRHANRIALAGFRAVYREQEERLRRTGSAPLIAALDTMAADPDVQLFMGTIDRVLASEEPTLLGISELATVFGAGLTLIDRYEGLVHLAAGEAMAVAHGGRVAAASQLRTALSSLAAVVVLTAVAALLIAWSMTRRLRRLALRAEQVSQGSLHGPPADERGPREVVVVARALNDTVANLRQIERQAAALAKGNLDDPMLAEPVAGGLGESIHATVHGLSEAWREREELQQRLAHQANHDLLTALPNRKAAMEALEQALGRANRHGDAVAVLFIDLDGFKRPNDTYGHHVGDRILRACAARLAATVRSGDVLARLGGDEFVVITERLAAPRHAVELGQRIIDVLSEPLDIGGISARVGASVGVGMSLDGRATPFELLRDADNAVHRAKKLGKGRVELFDEVARDELAAAADLERNLREALVADELCLHYQPVTDTVTGAVQGFEALCRWHRPDGPVSPAEFIPVAEQSDLVNDLGRWALRTAAAQLQSWTVEGRFADTYVAVNVSGRHLLSNTLVADVQAALDDTGLDPRRLVIEITETVIVTDLLTAVAHLDAVRALGVRVALDDFGTGYTSIGQLWRLPIDVLKIDGSFVRHLETAHDHVIVELIIEVAHTLGLGLVAEGVETVLQRDTLRALHCDAIQGYLVARPQAPEQLALVAGS